MGEGDVEVWVCERLGAERHCGMLWRDGVGVDEYPSYKFCMKEGDDGERNSI